MEAIVSGDDDASWLGLYGVAGTAGAGRVVAMGSDQILSNTANRTPDTFRFNMQALQWLRGNAATLDVAFIEGHDEVFDVNSASVLRGGILNAGSSVGGTPSVITPSVFNGKSVAVVGNARTAFTSSELDAIENFVRGGGGLYMAGLGWSYTAGPLSTYPMNTLGARFDIEWLTGTIEDPTNNLNGSPLFTTFYPNCENHLPDEALSTVQNLVTQHPFDLDLHLANHPADRRAYMVACANVAQFAANAPSGLRMNYDVQVRGLMQANPLWFGMEVTWDRNTNAAIGLGRAALGAAIVSAYPHDPLRLADIERALRIDHVAPEYATLLRDHGFLLLDNRSFGAPHFAMLLDHMNALVGVERDLQRMTVRNEIAADPSEQSFPIPGRGVNIFEPASLSPSRLENQFPPDHPARLGTVFSTTVVHEIGHIVDSYESRTSPAFAARKAALIAAAGTDDMQYLRAFGPRVAPFFQNSPQEFFASLCNQWCIDSVHTLRLGISRFDRGFQEPMRQALFIAEAYSANGATTPLFDMDDPGRSTIQTATFVRDAQGRVTAICSPDIEVRIEYDAAGDLTAVYEAELGSFTKSGRGCPSCSSRAIYEILPAGGWDLDGDSLLFTEDKGYRFPLLGVVREANAGPIALSANAVDAQAGDDTVTGPHPLHFSFPYRDATNSVVLTQQVDICSNGYVYLDAGTISGTRCCDGEAGYAAFLSESPSIAVLGTDLNASAAGSVLYDTQNAPNPATGFFQDVCIIEWRDVPAFGSTVGNTVQVQLWESGFIVICHLSTEGMASGRSALVGYSTGSGRHDCPGIDYTNDLPYFPQRPLTAGAPMTLDGSGSFAIGSQLELTVTDPVVGNPGGSALFMGNSTLDLPLSVIGGPQGCSLLVNPFFTINGAAGRSNYSIPLPDAPILLGASLHFQYVASDLSQANTHPVPVFTSNRGTVTLGSKRCGDVCSSAFELANGETSGSNAGMVTSTVTGACAPIQSEVWYRYTATCTGTATVSTCTGGGSADFDTVLAAFSGSCGNLTQIACNDDACGTQSEVSFAVTAGSVYYFAIGGYDGAEGDYVLHVDCQ